MTTSTIDTTPEPAVQGEPGPGRERSGTRRTIRRARRTPRATGDPAPADPDAEPSGTGRARSGDDSGMSTVEYAIGTVAAAAFAAILYAVVTAYHCRLSA